MLAKDVMTPDPVCCAPDAPLAEAARLMAERDFGAVPIVEDRRSRRLAGILTDRDIVCRAVARGMDPSSARAGECMSAPVISVAPETSLEDCAALMKKHRVRRLPVIDEAGACCGIVAQADLATEAPAEKTGDVVKKVSEKIRPAGPRPGRAHGPASLARLPAVPPVPRRDMKDIVQEVAEESFPASDAPPWTSGGRRGKH